jgi:hypothetical protein
LLNIETFFGQRITAFDFLKAHNIIAESSRKFGKRRKAFFKLEGITN